MFDKLLTRTNARFFRQEPKLIRKQIQSILAELAGRNHYTQKGARTIRKEVVTPNGAAKVSLAVFLVEQEPPFLQNSAVVEQRGAFIYLVELGDHVAVFYRNLGDIQSLLPDCLIELPHSTTTKVFADGNTRYERLNLRSMSIAKSVIRARTIEADDLRGLMSNVTARRSVPRGVRYTSQSGTLTVRPSVSRIQQQSPRQSASALAAWATKVISDLPAASTRVIRFLQHFPQPITLADKPTDIVPSGLLLQFDELFEQVQDGELQLLVGASLSTAVSPPSLDPAMQLLRHLSAVADVDASGDVLWSGQPVGKLVAHKVKYGFRSKQLEHLIVEEVASGDLKTLAGWLGRTQNFIVTFSDPQYAYVGGTLFRDLGLVAGKDLVLQMLETDWPVGACATEKGLNAAGTAHDPTTSLFGVTETALSPRMPWLVCDDMGDEWADYIGVDDRPTSPMVRFVHCKSGAVGLSASEFHVVVSQALKNLGRLLPADDEVTRKAANWSGSLGTGVPRMVPTTVAPTTADIKAAFARVNSDPQTKREVILVVNFLKKSEIATAFNQVAAGTHVAPAAVQLLWLLSSFAHACLDAGAAPRVKCLP